MQRRRGACCEEYECGGCVCGALGVEDTGGEVGKLWGVSRA